MTVSSMPLAGYPILQSGTLSGKSGYFILCPFLIFAYANNQ